MAIEKLLQNFADSTGIIVDHTLNPPRVLGQAFLVSKSRLVTCAGSVFNYIEAPWALSAHFPHPGINLGIKSIALHPEFDRKEARMNYLNQTAVTKYTYPVQFNDLATLVIASELKEPLPEEIMQLHKALSLAFSRDGVEVSGTLKENEFLEVVKKFLSSNRQGLLTLYDELNIPVAYIQISTSGIERVYYQGIVGEMAFAELAYKHTAKGFAFQPNYNFAWGDLRKIEMSPNDLINECVRRKQELPAFFSHLGGGKAVYQKVVKEFSAESFNPNIQWLVNNLWHTIDGYIAIDQLSERVGADTYTVVQGLRELANRGVVSIINKSSPFHLNGQLGTPIVSHTDFDINPGDALRAFYLDPVSGAPCWQDGDFAGVASVLQPKNLLHSIRINLRVPGALVVKNYKLIGVHNGPVQLKAGQTAERQLFQMMWIGALFDMGTKKLRATANEGEESEESQSDSSTKLSTLRVRDEEDSKVIAEKLEKYTCPVCFATNTQVGNCFNCGAVIENIPIEIKRKGFFIDKVPIKVISDLQEKYKISDRNTFIAIGVTGFLLLVFLSSLFNSCQTSRSTIAPVITQVENKNAEQSVKLAVNTVGFKGIAPPGYWFEDTSATTSPLSSFGIFSDANNQKVIFVIFNDMSPVNALDRFIQIPPFSDIVAPSTDIGEKVIKVSEGSQILGEGDFRYYVHTYPTASKVSKTMLVGSFPTKEPGKAVLVLGQALKEGNYDYKSTLFLVDAMAEPLTLKGNDKRLAGAKSRPNISGQTNKSSENQEQSSSNDQDQQTKNKLATEEEINAYCEGLQEKLKKKALQSHELEEVVKKRKVGKLKVVLDVDLHENGQLRKIDIIEPDTVQKVNDALVKVVKTSGPYEDIPKTESELLNLRVIFSKGGELKVEAR